MAARVMIVCTHFLSLLQSKTVTHTCKPIGLRERTLSGFVFSRRKNLLEFSTKAVFASMACSRKQITVEEKNAILSMHREDYCSRKIAEIFSRCNFTISRLVKRCDETGYKENRSRRGRSLKMSAH